ncbi:MAG: NB-ARC domain-containing protein, partial [Chloroflexota bacterium]|nr:NB-ARC domain-containing protein [Chloroflexota bacterium]
MSRVELLLFGMPRAEQDGRPVELKSRKGLALLAYLAVTGAPQSREVLATLLWPEHDQMRARQNLRATLFALNRTPLGAWLATDSDTIQLHPQLASAVDVTRFTQHISSGQLDELRQAAALYRGDFLGGFYLSDSQPFEEWAVLQREQYRRQVLDVLELLATHAIAQGDFDEAEVLARRQLELDNLCEGAWRQLLETLARAGARNEALAEYERCCQLLQEELGVAPASETVALHEAIVQGKLGAATSGGVATTGTVPDVSASPRHNIPAAITPLIGREEELRTLEEFLTNSDVRLVTITGAGGIGKTRLALQIAANLLDEFRDGIFFVNLAPLRDTELVIPTIAQTLNVREEGGQPLIERLKGYLGDKHLLLLLDNFEHLLAAGPEVTDLLAAAPHLKVLVTSRALLDVYGECIFAVSPLALPDLTELPPVERLTRYDALRLFIERAQAVKADFTVTNANAPAIAEICVRLDGLPLALELAAARVRLLPPPALLDRLESRLELLTSGSRDRPVRQQTLRNTMEWSYQLLSEAEQRLFNRLAVFVGGRTLEAIEAVCNAEGELPIDTLDGVASLVDKSLLRQEERLDGRPRFVMLETIHEYARERLEASGEADILSRRHAAYFLGLVEEAERYLTGPEQAIWLDRLERESYNIRAAFQWTAENGAAEMSLRLAGGLGRFWEMRGYLQEGREWLTIALARTGQPSLVRAKALLEAGALAYVQGLYQEARVLLEEALMIQREQHDSGNLAVTLIVMGHVISAEGNDALACSFHEESLSISRELGNKRGIMIALNCLAVIAIRSAIREGDYALVRSLLEDCWARARQVG